MVVKTGNKVYLVKFLHYNYEYVNPGTTCTIVDQETNDQVGFGESFVNLKAGDNFNKSAGRKISLTRAICYLPRELRILFWKEYWKCHAR